MVKISGGGINIKCCVAQLKKLRKGTRLFKYSEVISRAGVDMVRPHIVRLQVRFWPIVPVADVCNRAAELPFRKPPHR